MCIFAFCGRGLPFGACFSVSIFTGKYTCLVNACLLSYSILLYLFRVWLALSASMRGAWWRGLPCLLTFVRLHLLPSLCPSVWLPSVVAVLCPFCFRLGALWAWFVRWCRSVFPWGFPFFFISFQACFGSAFGRFSVFVIFRYFCNFDFSL